MVNYKIEKVIDSFDWDEFVSDAYNKIYCFQQQDGCQSRGNRYISVPTSHPYDYENTEIPLKVNGEEMGVSFETWLNTNPSDHNDEIRNVEIFWKRNFYPSIDMVINDLYEKGLLEEGNYTIKIDW